MRRTHGTQLQHRQRIESLLSEASSAMLLRTQDLHGASTQAAACLKAQRLLRINPLSRGISSSRAVTQHHAASADWQHHASAAVTQR